MTISTSRDTSAQEKAPIDDERRHSPQIYQESRPPRYRRHVFEGRGDATAFTAILDDMGEPMVWDHGIVASNDHQPPHLLLFCFFAIVFLMTVALSSTHTAIHLNATYTYNCYQWSGSVSIIFAPLYAAANTQHKALGHRRTRAIFQPSASAQ